MTLLQMQLFQFAGAGIVAAGLFALIWSGRMPSIQRLIDCANILNSKGGNLLLLAMMSAWFFYEALHFSYHLIDLMISKQLTTDNAIALSMFSFVTGTAFGGAFGALLKAMSGEAVTSSSASTVQTDTTTVKKVITPPTELPTGSTLGLNTPDPTASAQ
jgi:hypothetical protein